MLKLSELSQASYEPGHQLAVGSKSANSANSEISEQGEYTWSRFMSDVAATRAALLTDSNAAWGLFEPDTYRFAVGFVALLAEGKTVFLPGENHAAMVAALQAQGASFLGEFPDSRSVEVCEAHKGSSSDAFGTLQLSGSIVVFTSGSTGAPKGIAKSLAQIDNELEALEALWGERLDGAVIAGTVSQQHLYGLLFLVCWPLATGRPFWHRPFVDPVILAQELSHFEAAAWVMSPAHLHRLSSEMAWDSVRASTAAVFSSGGPLSPEGAEAVRAGLGQYPYEVLGSSETGGIAWRQQSHSSAPWQPFPGVAIRLDASSALAVKSPWLEDAQWYVTADQVILDDSGGFSLGGRLDRIVKLEGKRVSLPETEGALEQHPWVEECRVVVLDRALDTEPDKALRRRRSVLGAALVLSDVGRAQYAAIGHHKLTRALRSHLGTHVAAAATPRVWRVTPALERNSQGKILLSAIHALFKPKTLPKVQVVEKDESSCCLSLLIDRDNPYFQGHFAKAAVLPGVVQVLWAQQFAEALLGLTGDFAGMQKVKFRDLVFPEQELTLRLHYEAELGHLQFSFESSEGERSRGTLLYKTIP